MEKEMETPEIWPEKVFDKVDEGYILIDVRGDDEFVGELGHAQGAVLCTLGDDLTSLLNKEDREKKIIFICRSGKRSGRATHQALEMGFKHALNLHGGMLLWNELQLPVVRG